MRRKSQQRHGGQVTFQIMILRKVMARTALLIPLLWPAITLANGVNPHLGEDSCQSCHTKVPSTLEVQSGTYFLQQNTIEETCGMCHPEAGFHTSMGHPTGIQMTVSQDQPLTLPLKDGKITCKTCHHCIANDTTPTFAMLRIINRDQSFDEELTRLCRECHIGY